MRREWQIRNLKNMVKQKNVVRKKREERMADQEFKKMWHGKKFEKFEKLTKNGRLAMKKCGDEETQKSTFKI